jgi:Tfp pilus assembly protein PilN
MRPVNLIPAEERPGGRRPLRGGPLAYIVVGALAAALIGISVLVITNNQISDRKAEVVQLEQETASAEAQAQALSSYTQFHSVREQRVATITSLADSRFDWERVMHELALVLPTNIWLTSLTGTASPGASVGGGASVSMRGSIPGPALEMVGCGTGQGAVAGFVQALQDIDGVTRVGVQSSALGGNAGGSAAASTCQTRDFIAQFQLVVAFDAAPVAPEEGATEAAPVAPEATTETTSGEAATSEEGEG